MEREYEQRVATGAVTHFDVGAGMQFLWEKLRAEKSTMGVRGIPRWRWN